MNWKETKIVVLVLHNFNLNFDNILNMDLDEFELDLNVKAIKELVDYKECIKIYDADEENKNSNKVYILRLNLIEGEFMENTVKNM